MMYPKWLILLVGVMLSACGLFIGGLPGAFVIGLTLGVAGVMVYFHKEISNGLSE